MATRAESMLGALRLVREGRILSLDSGWWRRMPVPPAHPTFDILTYRTPWGMRNEGDPDWMLPPANTVGFGFITEFMMGSAHTGTHMDALCHVTCGQHNQWHGGASANEKLSDFGSLDSDATELEPIVGRGVMLDIPALLQRDTLEPHHGVDGAQLADAAARQGVEIGAGDTVLIRTGQMRFWPDEEAMAAVEGAGLALDGARWLSERGVRAVGGDTLALECVPTGVEGNPLPVHTHLLIDCGIPIIEWVNCEQLSAEGISEFLFICLPMGVRGATGSMVRPVAVV